MKKIIAIAVIIFSVAGIYTCSTFQTDKTRLDTYYNHHFGSQAEALMTSPDKTYSAGDILPSASINNIEQGVVGVSTAFQYFVNYSIAGAPNTVGLSPSNVTTSASVYVSALTTGNYIGFISALSFCKLSTSVAGGQWLYLESSNDGSTWSVLTGTQIPDIITANVVVNNYTAITTHTPSFPVTVSWAGTFSSNTIFRTVFSQSSAQGLMSGATYFTYEAHVKGGW